MDSYDFSRTYEALYQSPENCERAYRLALKLATSERVSPSACFIVGKCLTEGRATQEDKVQGSSWFEKAFTLALPLATPKHGELGDAEAQCVVALCYRFGVGGVERDFEKVIYW